MAEELRLDGSTAVFGPSGGGKSTLLRLIAGFETPDAGRIAMDGGVWFDGTAGIDVPPYRRPVGYMFQDGRLFAHLTVGGNLEYADKRSSAVPQRYALSDVVDAFSLGSLLPRRIDALSGGERQRVALARTILTRPKLLLLDEPLAALDRSRKNEILPYLENLPRRFGIPSLYVSHDLDEVSRLADKVLVLAGGRVLNYGPAVDVIGSLDLEPITGSFEAGSLVEGRVSGHDARLKLTHIEVGGAAISMPLNERLSPGDAARLRIRARDVAVATTRPAGISIRNILPGHIAEIGSQPETTYAAVVIDLGSARLRARLTRASVEDLGLVTGMPVFALVKSVSFEGS